MKKNNERTMIASLDGKQKISVQEFDQLFDNGSDAIDEYVDWAQARPGSVIRPGQQVMVRTLLNRKFFSENTRVMGESQKRKNALHSIPASEMWLYENKSALASVRKGLKEAARGAVHSLGSFAS